MYQMLENYLRTFVTLNQDEWAAMEERLVVKYYAKGAMVIRAGEVCRHVYFINKGLMRSFKRNDEGDSNVQCFAETRFISSYESFITRTPSLLNVEALEDSEAILLSYDDLQYLYARYPVFERLGRLIAESLVIMLAERNLALQSFSPEEKYLQLIRESPDLIQRVPQYMIASYIGVTPETLSRIRKKMAQKKSRNPVIAL